MDFPGEWRNFTSKFYTGELYHLFVFSVTYEVH